MNGEPQPTHHPTGAGRDETSIRVAAAIRGSAEDIEWIILRFSPILEMQARRRLPPNLRSLFDPQDLAAEVWALTLPRLRDIRSDDGRLSPILIRFLGTTLLNLINNLIRKHLAGKPLSVPIGTAGGTSSQAAHHLASPTTAVELKVARSEDARVVREALEGLEGDDQEIITLRMIEGASNRYAAERLGITEGASAMRLQRALTRLAGRLPPAMVCELFPDRDS